MLQPGTLNDGNYKNGSNQTSQILKLVEQPSMHLVTNFRHHTGKPLCTMAQFRVFCFMLRFPELG